MSSPIKAPKNYGLKIAKPKPEDYIFGSSPLLQEILQPDGQWDEFLPTENESQKINMVDGHACVSFGTLNCVEVLLRKLYNI